MLSRENVTREALSNLEAQRAANLMEEKRRRAEAEEKSPAVRDLLAARQRLFFSGMRGAFASPAKAREISQNMQKEMERINSEIRASLLACGLPQDYLQPVYRCSECRDTGYVGEPVHEMCACLKRAVMNRLYQSEGLQGLERENFAAFNESIFPEKPIEEYSQGQRDYIALGEKNGENEGYKCQIRDRWYQVPSIWVPDAFFLRRNNLYPKFVLNCCHAVSTDTMHRVKFHEGIEAERIILSYYNSISFAFTEICGRSYGGGVLEILPGEVGNIMLPVIKEIDEALKNELLKRIDTIVRNDEDIEVALDLVDQKLLVEVLGIDKNICTSCRQIWKKMQKRRLGRGE